MTELPKDSGISFTPFFGRCKLPASVRDKCDAFVKARFPEQAIRPAPFQGYCSYTLFVGEDTVVQFRPSAHKLDPEITTVACQVFGHLAPETESMGELGDTGLHVFSMRKIPGVSLSDLRAEPDPLKLRSQREQIVRDFARLQATSWKHGRAAATIKDKRTVGSSLRWRLELMAATLPLRFRGTARSLLVELASIEHLPWTFSHGDFLPANVMICLDSGKLLGLLDWAEAEWLPFGVGMYGLDELLGEERNGDFVYYPEARQLRTLYWRELLLAIPELAKDAGRVAVVRKAQLLGVLLWHGIAFDDGKLNRAVGEGRDDEEIKKLDAFLSPSKHRPNKFRHIQPFLLSHFTLLRGYLFGKA
ncbi:Uu.00g002660.m01.CDS01 [Anthostomella pinea]|uniref:Uu.00g002660.m01.CDS01 n=1 Tax=Anthostomella pinea TaxID=933095 RepID=A0AAI8YII8_9PEZI|nr:Uu.00g002660.m01.CDS01 [Anthostomella pinea]